MQRDDWLWLAIKVAAIYLLVSAVESLAGAVGALLEPKWAGTSAAGFVASGATSGLAGLLLLVRGPRWLGARERAPDNAATDAHTACRPARQDWLWLGCKGLGLWFVASAVTSYLAMLRFPEVARSVWVFVTLLITAMLGCWLLLSDALPRLAGDGLRKGGSRETSDR